MTNSPLPTTLVVLITFVLYINLIESLHTIETCHAHGHLKIKTNSVTYIKKNVSNHCQPHKTYPKYICSPPIKQNTHAIMTINSFSKHGRLGGSYISNNGNKYHHTHVIKNVGGEDRNRYSVITMDEKTSKCNKKYYGDKELVVALSTGWYNGGSRCLKNIRIKGNKKSVVAKVVDECDSNNGCDSSNGFRVPCDNNIIVASPAVWKALGIPKSKFGNFKVTWTDV